MIAESENNAEQFEFHSTLAQRALRPLIVPALIAINLLVYLLISAQGAGWISADPQQLIGWGSNFGPLTTGGEWWRLLTAMFLHGGLIHLLVNMYALYDTGRLSEQLYGRPGFLALYILSGLCGSAASVWWNPAVNSVGASGAIFGVFGALLVFMLDKRNGVPPSIMKTHQASIGIFIVYTLFYGMTSNQIDNAAHLGGLLGGVLLGWAFARPFAAQAPHTASAFKPIVGVVVAGLGIFVLLALAPNTRSGYELQQRFLNDVHWFESEEQRLIGATKTAFERTRNQKSLSPDAKAEMTRIAAEWGELYNRLSAYQLAPGSRKELVELQSDLVEYVDLRHRAMKALVAAADAPPQQEAGHQKEFRELWKQSMAVGERISARAKTEDVKKAR